MKILINTLLLISLILFLSPAYSAYAYAYANNDGISVTRNIPSTAIAGETIPIKVTINIGAGITNPINGFYFADEIPANLTIETGSYKVTLNGLDLTNIIEEIGSEGDVFDGAIPYRFIFETPPDFSDYNPLNAGDELILSYQITIPSDEVTGNEYTFPGYNWVGCIQSDPVFGYEDLPEITLIVTDTTTAESTTTTTTTSKNCFAKEIYGDNSEEAELLRSLRDNVFRKTPERQEIIRLYYEWSPTILQTMNEDEEFRKEVIKTIDTILLLFKKQ